ncbi:MAG: murein L,D-transpeptidase family protein [Halocynthiibacter sp.]
MKRSTFIKGLLALPVLSGCAAPTVTSKFRSYDGPEVTRVLVYKGDRRLMLLNGTETLKTYKIDLGFAPVGDKKVEGDGKTPEGDYIIDRRNPNSLFHLSIGISYPNDEDRAEAAALGQSPGGDIFIHGGPRRQDGQVRDWTWGCISVTDRQIETIYAMVENRTPISIYP